MKGMWIGVFMVFLFLQGCLGNYFGWVEVAGEEVDSPNQTEGAPVTDFTFAGITSAIVSCHLEVGRCSIRP